MTDDKGAVDMNASVFGVALSGSHSFSKPQVPSIRLLAGLGVEGDAHCGATVKHRSRVAKDPNQPNLRQVHLIHAELLSELAAKGYEVAPGQMGENITTTGIALLDLPRGTRLHLGDEAVIEVTGLRNPCGQIEAFKTGLLAEVVSKTAENEIVRKSGIMSIVICGGEVKPGDAIKIEWPPEPHHKLEKV